MITLSVCASCSDLGPIFGPDAPDTIGPANGTKEEEIGRETFTKADPVNCGYNDLSLPNPAVYIRITYRVHHYDSNGKEVSTSTRQSEKYDHCASP